MAKRKVSQVFTASGDTVSKSRVKKVRSEYAISVKRLAELNSPNTCERCFYARSKFHGKGRDVPWNFGVPGLLSRMDSLEKQVIAAEETFPNFLSKFEGMTLLKSHRMSVEDKRTGIVVSGVPDLIFQDEMGALKIRDMKTAKPKTQPASGDTSGFEKIASLYGAQVNIYRWLLMKQGIGVADDLGLIYLWPDEASRCNNGLSVKFLATDVAISVDDKMMDRLLARARRILLADVMPDGREDCLDCVRCAHFLSVFQVETREERNILRDSEVFVP